MIRVLIPSQLHSYTHGQRELSIEARTLTELADRLEHAFPGIRFRVIDELGRIRRHIQFFVNGEIERELGRHLDDGDEVHIIGALSGG